MHETLHDASWYIARSGETQGPYTWSQLQTAVRQGLLRPRDWVWRQGMPKWVRASEKEGLLAPRKMPPPLPGHASASGSTTAGEPPGDGFTEGDVGDVTSDAIVSSVTATAPTDDGAGGAQQNRATVFIRPRVGERASGDGAARPSAPPEPDELPMASDGSDALAPDRPLVVGSIDLSRSGSNRSASAPPGAWLPTPGPIHPVTSPSLGETTRQFLAAAGVSAKVRLRRMRRKLVFGAVAMAAMGGLVYFAWPAKIPPPEDLSAALTAKAKDSTDVDAQALGRIDTCRLTGDCRRSPGPRARQDGPDLIPAAAEPTLPRSEQRGDVQPERIDIGTLETGGAKPLAVLPKTAALPELERDDVDETLSATQTTIVKNEVSAVLKQCRGVFAASKVVMRVKTDPEGRVRRVKVPRGPRRVRKCLERRARRWRFGTTLASRSIALTVPAKKGVVRVSAGEFR